MPPPGVEPGASTVAGSRAVSVTPRGHNARQYDAPAVRQVRAVSFKPGWDVLTGKWTARSRNSGPSPNLGTADPAFTAGRTGAKSCGARISAGDPKVEFSHVNAIGVSFLDYPNYHLICCCESPVRKALHTNHLRGRDRQLMEDECVQLASELRSGVSRPGVEPGSGPSESPMLSVTPPR